MRERGFGPPNEASQGDGDEVAKPEVVAAADCAEGPPLSHPRGGPSVLATAARLHADRRIVDAKRSAKKVLIDDMPSPVVYTT